MCVWTRYNLSVIPAKNGHCNFYIIECKIFILRCISIFFSGKIAKCQQRKEPDSDCCHIYCRSAAFQLVDGAANGALFVDFLHGLQPHLPPNAVIVMDNVHFNHAH